jgi:hypothetical protein
MGGKCMNVSVCCETAEVDEESVNSRVYIDIKDHMRSYCMQFSENLEKMKAQMVDDGILLKFWNGNREVQIWLDSVSTKKLIDFTKALDI